jgi:CubicO group peptidase (beta-lactamase class C family)
MRRACPYGGILAMTVASGLIADCCVGVSHSAPPVLAQSHALPVAAAGAVHYWPSSEWRTSTPEEQGVSSGLLAELLRFIEAEKKNIHNVVIVRHGYVILQTYTAPYHPDTKRDLYSATKSVTSALIGLAIEDGHIRGVQQKILGDIFPDLRVANPDQRKGDMTIAHLLEMTTGLRWNESSISYARASNAVNQMYRSQDWVQFVLGRPMAGRPGETFNYNSGASQLLSAVVQKQVGMPAAEYAEKRLFRPLGISDYYWPANDSGLSSGSSGLQLTPIDMARFGYLYLRDGVWNGERLLPAGWVEQSTRKHQRAIRSTDFRYRVINLIRRAVGRRASQVPTMDYGYHWWIPSFGGYAARGWGGQAIFVLPTLDMVVVFTGGLSGPDNFLLDTLMEKYIISAVKSAGSLTANSKATASLEAIAGRMTKPQKRLPAVLPQTARDISGRTFTIRARKAILASFSLTFNGSDEALMAAVQGDTDYKVVVGLDNVFRTSRISDRESISARGHWTNEKTFVLDWCPLAAGDRVTITLTFENKRVKVRSESAMTGRVQYSEAKLRP